MIVDNRLGSDVGGYGGGRSAHGEPITLLRTREDIPFPVWGVNVSGDTVGVTAECTEGRCAELGYNFIEGKSIPQGRTAGSVRSVQDSWLDRTGSLARGGTAQEGVPNSAGRH